MATLKSSLAVVAIAGLALAGCGKLVGLDTPVTPIAQIQVLVTGDIASVQRADTVERTPQLHVALVWGAQWLPEPFCVLPPESPAAAAVIAAGCPDSFRFVPDVAAAYVAVEPGVPATIDLINLPSADVMVGDITARVAYASLIVYDDRNGNGTLDFHHALRRRHEEDYNPGMPATRDIPYGASFISMTLPDQRVAYHEGGDFNAAFYPRNNCAPAPPGFSVLSAGGFPPPDFSQPAALLAAASGQFPEEDPTTCGVAKLSEVVVTIPLQDPTGLTELACTVTDAGGTTFYREPPADPPDLSKAACVGFPHLPGDDPGVANGRQVVVPGALTDPCHSVNHYTLRGCNNDPNCATPNWDVAATPPAWWPCPTTP
jgi:hypothetical protein